MTELLANHDLILDNSIEDTVHKKTVVDRINDREKRYLKKMECVGHFKAKRSFKYWYDFLCVKL